MLFMPVVQAMTIPAVVAILTVAAHALCKGHRQQPVIHAALTDQCTALLIHVTPVRRPKQFVVPGLDQPAKRVAATTMVVLRQVDAIVMTTAPITLVWGLTPHGTVLVIGMILAQGITTTVFVKEITVV